MLGEISHGKVDEAALIKIHVGIRRGPSGGDAIQSSDSLKITMVV